MVTRSAAAFLLLTTSLAAGASAQSKPPISIATQGNFMIGGHYLQGKDGQFMVDQMYVQYQIPAHKTHPYPLVMIHGGGQTGQGWYETPDGREGWATYFLRQGYAVYVVDQAGRGRSGFFSDSYGATRKPSTKAMSQRFTDPEATALYPQAKFHRLWPGKGVAGDANYDQFFATQVEDMTDLASNESINRAAGDALLDKIGPVILITHSQSGPIGWGIANDRPDKVKLLIALEPSGPPFHEIEAVGAPLYSQDGTLTRPYGLTINPLDYEPPLAAPADLKPEQQSKPDQPDLARCWKQSAPVHILPKLQKVPVMMLGSEASYHVPYDHCTAAYLTQAGVKTDFIRLPEVGLSGNGHFLMLEKNSDQVAKFVQGWIEKRIH